MSGRAPLAGRRVLVTRARHQSSELSNLLRERGAVPVELPVIEIVPTTGGELDAALSALESYDWIVFTSVNAVEIVADRLQGRLPKIAATGDATAAALHSRGLTVDLVPTEFVGEAVLEALVSQGIAGQKILLPRAEIGRSVLPDGLRAAGALVDDVPVYTTRLPVEVDAGVLEMIRSGEIDIVTFTSPSTVHNLLELLGGPLPSGTLVACIGPVSARAARQHGLNVDIMASEYTIPGLVEALAERDTTDERE